MTDINILTSQVKANCNISDAKCWGNYTLCTLLLELRELYKFENEIRHWEAIKKEAILDWISERERLWAELEDKEFLNIKIDNIAFPAYDNDSINRKLLSRNIFYGAGYSHRMKPSFFLADLDKSDVIEGCALYIAGQEYARDLAASPAMLQDKKIIVRKDVILRLLWDKFNEMQMNKSKTSLTFAFKAYNISPDEDPSEHLNGKLIKILDYEMESYIYHEVGELFEAEKLGEQWKHFLSVISNSRIELLARSIKDLLADTSEKGMLRHIIHFRKEGSLAFYVSALRGYRKVLFKEIYEAFEKFMNLRDWSEIEKISSNCYKKALNYAEIMLNHFQKDTERIRLIEQIEKEFSSFF